MKPLVNYITDEKRFFETDNIELVPGLHFNQFIKVRRDFNYYMSNFESGEIDSQGFKKYFLNVVRNPKNITMKEISFEPKDILFNTTGSGNAKKTWLLERDFKYWAKTNHLASQMMKVFSDVAWFGSAVIKTIGSTMHQVDLRNLYVQPDADSLDTADWIIEIHPYSLVQFEQAAIESGWKHWQKALDEAILSEFPEITVFERYGLIRKSELLKATGGSLPSSEKDDLVYTRVILSDINIKGSLRRDITVLPSDGIILDVREVKTHPYWEFHGEKIPGRWIGVGVVELLRDVQMRMNEMINLKVKSSYLATLQIFQTQDESIESNLLTDHKIGDIFYVDDLVHRIDTQDRNLASFGQEEGTWLNNRDEVTLARDVLRGERLPSGTPLGAVELVAGMARGYFDFIKRGLADSMKEYIYDVVIPAFEQEVSTDHILRLVGEDLAQYREMFVEADVRKRLFAHIQRTNTIPDAIEIDVFRAISEEEMLRERELALPLPEGFYKDAEYDLDIIITGQYEDTRVSAANLQTALQLLMQRPDMLQNPILRKIFKNLLEKGGVRLEDIEGDIARAGINQALGDLPLGGISGPEIGGEPVPGETELTV